MSVRRVSDGPLRYVTDADGIVTAVGGSWAAFALDNDAPALAEGIGISIWDSMASSETRQVYRHLLARARPGVPLIFDYRCDAPRLRRDMRMTVTCAPGGGWHFESAMLQAAPLSPGPRRIVHRAGAGLGELRVCSWCNRVRDDRGWTDFEEFAVRAGLLLGDDHPGITHGICQECHDRLLLPSARAAALV